MFLLEVFNKMVFIKDLIEQNIKDNIVMVFFKLICLFCKKVSFLFCEVIVIFEEKQYLKLQEIELKLGNFVECVYCIIVQVLLKILFIYFYV